MQIFEVIPFFKLRTTIQQKTIKPTYFFSPLDARKLAEGKGHLKGRKKGFHCIEQCIVSSGIENRVTITACLVQLAKVKVSCDHGDFRCVRTLLPVVLYHP